MKVLWLAEKCASLDRIIEGLIMARDGSWQQENFIPATKKSSKRKISAWDVAIK